MTRGLFITFEGPEGSGKSTHSRLLCDYLCRKGYKVVHIREPGGTKISERIRKLLLDPDNKGMSSLCELFLYLASRSQLVKDVISPALNKGRVVICDRFSDATLAYQGYGSGLDIKMVKYLCSLASFNIEPELTILLDISPNEGLRRAGRFKDRLERKSIQYHRRVRNGYLKIAGMHPKRFIIFSSKEDTKLVQERLRKKIMEIFKVK